MCINDVWLWMDQIMRIKVDNHQILIARWIPYQWGSTIKLNGNSRKLLQIQMEKRLLFLLFQNTGDGQVLQSQQWNALLQNMHAWLEVWGGWWWWWWGLGGILTGIPSSRHCYSAGFIKCNWEDCSLSWCIAFDFIIQTDSLTLMMHGFQRSRSHVPSFGKSFCIINLLQSEFDCYKNNVQ